MGRSTILFCVTIILLLTTIISANSVPISIKEFDEIILKQGISRIINLSEYYEDPEGDEITYEITNTTGITINLVLDELEIFPEEGFFGVSNMNIKISDSENTMTNLIWIYILEDEENNSSNETNSVNEENSTNINHPPTLIMNQDKRIIKKVGEEIILSVNASDIDGDNLNYFWYINDIRIQGNSFNKTFKNLEIGQHIITLETSDEKNIIISSWTIIIEKRINKALRWAIVILTLVGLGTINYFLINLLRKERERKIMETDEW
jgi:hypothetical protein